MRWFSVNLAIKSPGALVLPRSEGIASWDSASTFTLSQARASLPTLDEA